MTLTDKVLGWLQANPSKCINADQAAALFNEQEGRHVVTRKADAEHIRVWRTL